MLKKIKSKFIKAAKVLLLSSLLLGLCGCSNGIKDADIVSVSRSLEETDEAPLPEQPTVSHEDEIKIYICGEVNAPGVYKLHEGDRVIDALEMAGGETENAYLLNVNLAEPLYDGEMIVIYDEEEAKLKESIADEVSKSDGRININSATAEELKTLPGIGDSKANNIISYRSDNKFASASDITKVSGIGNALYEQIKDKITV